MNHTGAYKSCFLSFTIENYISTSLGSLISNIIIAALNTQTSHAELYAVCYFLGKERMA